ncbi:sugar ABC transporter substrate-binding protein [Frigoribacterium sp. CFBP9039]|uniref:ABC transporter substrate-binding protein n=1 Tax=Frigoribacterium sp. CFBP9029 TaxID=3096541 RepID=UPI002A6B7B65|nr:sugar ABC transporter substrate-binding protein [Frigoribacterium sp. CFBP9039]MDY0945774.1 sugar ABC transporter substrate-binding protein [Frigoribacterium sp. CFBP9039]
MSKPLNSAIVAGSVCVAIVAASALGITAFGLANSGHSGPSRPGPDEDQTTVTVRVWDETVAAGYEKSFATFERDNPDIDIEVDVVPYGEYFTTLADDVESGEADDIFWLNSSNYTTYADAGALLDIDRALARSSRAAWSPAVVDQFTTADGHLWGVPQLSDGGIALYYNADLLKQAGIDPAALDDLTWAAGGGEGDTLLPVLKKLTRDAAGRTADDPAFDGTPVQYGYNAGNDLQAVWYDYLASAGGAFENDDMTAFAFDTEEARVAFQYVVDLVQQARVAPPAALTNDDADFSREQFAAGKMALFQSGLYSLSPVAAGADFEWGVAPMPAGPEGRVSVTNGIVAAGNSASPHRDDTAKVLAWLGSTDGAKHIGADGAAVPAVLGAQEGYYDHWTAQGVDVRPFFDVIDDGPTIAAPSDIYGRTQSIIEPIFDEMFAGRISVEDALARAQSEANAALETPPAGDEPGDGDSGALN